MIMKVQTLNKTQQKRLLELCEEFFPHYKQIFSTGDNGEFISFLSHKEIYGFKARTVIHWYQLCLTELPKRIFDAMDEDNDSEELYYLLNDGEGWGAEEIQIEVLKSKHPVDFLWNFVKECKKNKYFKE
jgi:hypothetical protein